jgi:membrane protease subunit HflK
MRGDQNGDIDRRVLPGPDAELSRLPPRVVLLGVLIIVGLSMLLTVFYTVEADEMAVVQRFGKYIRREEPGLHYKLPWRIETVQKVKVRRVLTAEFGFRTEEPGVRMRFSARTFPEESIMLTGDLNVADVRWIVQYRIVDPVKYLFGNRRPDASLQDVAQIVMRTVVGDHAVTEVLTEGRVEIANRVQQKMQELLDLYATGLRVETVKMQDVTPPSEAVKRAFNEVNEAQQERERKINEARQAYNQEVPRERDEAERTIGKADAEAADIYADAYSRDGEFYGFYQTLEAYKQTLQKNSSLLLTTDSDFYRYLKNTVPPTAPADTR